MWHEYSYIQIKEETEQIPLIIPLSGTAKTASNIVNHHFQICKQLTDVFEHQNNYCI